MANGIIDRCVECHSFDGAKLRGDNPRAQRVVYCDNCYGSEWLVTLSVPVIVRVEVRAKTREGAEEYARFGYHARDVAAHATDGELGDDADVQVLSATKY